MASFLQSIHTVDYDTFKLSVFRGGGGGWHFKKHIKELVFCIADAFVALKECIAMLSETMKKFTNSQSPNKAFTMTPLLVSPVTTLVSLR